MDPIKYKKLQSLNKNTYDLKLIKTYNKINIVLLNNECHHIDILGEYINKLFCKINNKYYQSFLNNQDGKLYACITNRNQKEAATKSIRFIL